MKKLLDTADGDMIHYTPMEKKSDKIFIGIDPGKDGAMAVLRSSDTCCSWADVCPFDRDGFTRALALVAHDMHDGAQVSAVLEHVGAMPGQGSVSMFNFGQNFGWIQGVLDAHRIPYELVRPQKWKKVFSCTSDKNSSVEVARRLFPHIDLRRTPKCTKPHDGICEALLMASYAKRHFGGDYA
jgi:hypothetical protein